MKFILPTFLVFILLAGCTPPTPPPSPTPWPSATEAVEAGTPYVTPTATRRPGPTFTPDVTTITLWEGLPAAQAELLAEESRAFAESFPRYRVELHHYDAPEAFLAQFETEPAGFDVILAPPLLLNSLWTAEQLAPMSELFPPSFIDGFAATTLQGARAGGEVWGLADTAGFHLLLFYHRDLVETPPATMTGLNELAQTLNNGPGLGLNSYDPLWVIPWLAAHGGWPVDGAGRPTLNTGAMTRTLTLYQNWHDPDTGLAPLVDYDEMRRRFIEGELGLMIDGEWAIGELAQVEGLAWEVAPLPGLDPADDYQPPAPLVLARYWAVSRAVSGNRVPAVTAFLEYITRPERQLTWTGRFGLLPTRRAALTHPTIVTDPVLRTSVAQMAAGRSLPLGVEAAPLLDAMRAPLRALLAGDLNPAEAAAHMQQNVEQ